MCGESDDCPVYLSVCLSVRLFVVYITALSVGYLRIDSTEKRLVCYLTMLAVAKFV
jgi:hypothetical protein